MNSYSFHCKCLIYNSLVIHSDVARPLSYRTKTTYFFRTKTKAKTDKAKTKTKTTFSRPLILKTIKFLTQDLKKRSLIEKIKLVMPVLPSHAGIVQVTEKKPAYYLLSSQVLLHPKLGS